MSPQQTVRILQNSRVPALGLGTWQLSGRAAEDSVAAALDIGYRHIDTAQIYENEAEVGRGLRAGGTPRESIFLTTKVWMSQVAPDRVRPSVEESLRKLQTEYVDLLLIHWPVKDVPLEATLAELFRLQHEGKTRHVGVSNFPIALLEAALKHGPIFNNQVERHPYLAQTRLTHFCQAHGVLLTAYSPLARGKVSDDPVLTEIGAQYGKTAAQVALRWFLEQDGVAVIPKAAKRAHLEANFNIFDFSLSAEDMTRIAALDRGQRLIHPGWAPAWD